MTNKLSGRYCFKKHWSEWSDDNLDFYCIPIELKEKFEKMTKEILSILWDSPQDNFLEKAELFNNAFNNFRLDKPIDKYTFTDLQEIKE